MENASKALIIAGAILLSILIIALGVYIFNIAKNAVNTDQVDALSRSSFNSPIQQYEGRKIGSSVKDLLQDLIGNTDTNRDADDKLPDITYLDEEEKGPAKARTIGEKGVIESTVSEPNANLMSSLMSSISNTHYYYIKTKMNTKTGLIDMIYICYSESDSEVAQEAIDNAATGKKE